MLVLKNLFTNNEEQLKHYKAEHPGKAIFNCNQCKYSTNYASNLKSHIETVHDNKVRQSKSILDWIRTKKLYN